jgi:DNA polymerase IV
MHRGLTTVVDARVLYVDMNAFFASIEQNDEPVLRGKPVAVCSHTTERGSVLACSYPAKALGIGTGMRVAEALERCPGLAIRTPRPRRYKEVHVMVMDILRKYCGPEVQVRSVDEAAIFLSKNWQNPERAVQLAATIKQAICKEVGPAITCSVGIAPNSLLAKVATNMQKPDGLVQITKENLHQTLAKLQLTDLPGIASRNALRLTQLGIETPLQLATTPSAELSQLLGIWGMQWWWRLNGYESDDFWNSNPIKTMSHEHVLPHWVRGHAQVLPVVRTMTERLVHRLRRNQASCKGIGVSLRLAEYPSVGGEHTFDVPTSDYPTLTKTVSDLVLDIPLSPKVAIRKVSIHLWGVSDTSTAGQQLDLFSERDRGERFSVSLEHIRSRHGFHSIQPASSMLKAHQIADEQIGFGRIKDKPGVQLSARR